MKNLFLSLLVFLATSVSSAAITEFDSYITIYTSLIPADDPHKMWYRNEIQDVFRLKMEEGRASLYHGYGPGTKTVGKPIKWVKVFENIQAKVTTTRWTTHISIPTKKGVITVMMQQSSRANADKEFIDADFDIPMGFKLHGGDIITKFNAGFVSKFDKTED